jgi:hypothetical protein
MAGTKFNLYRVLRRFAGPVRAYRLANGAMGFLDAAKPLATVSCGAVVIHAAALSAGVI